MSATAVETESRAIVGAEGRRRWRLACRALAWLLPLVALVVGIALTATGSAEIWAPYADDPSTYEVSLLAVWPAGLVLLGAGLLGLMAVAIVEAFRPAAPALRRQIV